MDFWVSVRVRGVLCGILLRSLRFILCRLARAGTFPRVMGCEILICFENGHTSCRCDRASPLMYSSPVYYPPVFAHLLCSTPVLVLLCVSFDSRVPCRGPLSHRGFNMIVSNVNNYSFQMPSPILGMYMLFRNELMVWWSKSCHAIPCHSMSAVMSHDIMLWCW